MLCIHCDFTKYSVVPSRYPSNLRVTSVTSTSLTFTWDKLDPDKLSTPITGYLYYIFVHPHGHGSPVTGRIEPDAYFHRVQFTSKPYAISLAAINNAGIGVRSPLVQVPYTHGYNSGRSTVIFTYHQNYVAI